MPSSTQYLACLIGVISISLSCQEEGIREKWIETEYALEFDGATSAFEIPMIRDQQPAQLTVEVMVKFAEGQDESIPIISHSDMNQWNQAEGFGLKYESRILYWSLASSPSTAESFSARVDLVPETWYHIACTFDGRIGCIYLDGKLIVEGSRQQFIDYGHRGISFGKGRHTAFGGELHFKGLMDEVRIWDHARTAGQIRDHLRRTLAGTEPGLVGYWNFNSRAEFLEPAEDRSPFHNHGQVFGKIRLVRLTALNEK